jgi:methionyl-tRNA synthetase
VTIVATSVPKTIQNKIGGATQRLSADAERAVAAADAAKAQVRSAKAELKKARKSLKAAKKVAKRARKKVEAEAAGRRAAAVKEAPGKAVDGAKRPRPVAPKRRAAKKPSPSAADVAKSVITRMSGKRPKGVPVAPGGGTTAAAPETASAPEEVSADAVSTAT